MTLAVGIAGCGKYLPERVLSNHDLARLVDTTDDWIYSRTGIPERRIAAPHESVASMAAEAGRRALRSAGISPAEIDLILVATCTSDSGAPAAAARVQAELEARAAGYAMDVNMGCVGAVAAMITGAAYIRAGICQTVLVCGSDCLSRWVDWTDRNSCVLFGDGAGAVVLRASEQGGEFLDQEAHTDGNHAEIVRIEAPKRPPAGAGLSWEAAPRPSIRMNGRELFGIAVMAVSDLLIGMTARHGLKPGQLDLVIPHQANARILEEIASTCGIPHDKVMTTLERYGNNAAASVLVALADAVEQSRLREGDLVAFVGYGAGVSRAGALYRW